MFNNLNKHDIAALSMVALLKHSYVQRGAYPGEDKWALRFNPEKAAKLAYEYADALLVEKRKQETKNA